MKPLKFQPSKTWQKSRTWYGAPPQKVQISTVQELFEYSDNFGAEKIYRTGSMYQLEKSKNFEFSENSESSESSEKSVYIIFSKFFENSENLPGLSF